MKKDMAFSWYFCILSLIYDNIIIDWNLQTHILNICACNPSISRASWLAWNSKCYGGQIEISFGHREKIAGFDTELEGSSWETSMLLNYSITYRSLLISYSPFNTQATTYLNELPCGKCVCICNQSIPHALFRTLLATSDRKSTQIALRGKGTLLTHITKESTTAWHQGHQIQRLQGCHWDPGFGSQSSVFMCGASFLRQWCRTCQKLQFYMFSPSHCKRKKLSLSCKISPMYVL